MKVSERQPAIVCYVSSHGFGHAVRVMEVLREVRLRDDSLRFVIRTGVRRDFFERNLTGPFEYEMCRLDVGAVQSDSITVDPEATLRAYAEFVTRKEEILRSEQQAVERHRPAVVLGDIPALAFDVALSVGVAGVAMTNFSWDWIYADYARELPEYAHLIEDLRGSYARATLLLRLPFHGDLSAFPRVRDIPLVARRARIGREEVRQRLGLPDDEYIVLLSFGGMGLDLVCPPQVPQRVHILSLGAETGGATVPPGCQVLSSAKLAAVGIRHEDLVGASDAVMTKPGYGIIAECIANGTPIVYTSRGRFAEYGLLVAAIERHLPHAFIGNEDLRAGRWAEPLDRIRSQGRETRPIDVSGAAMAAEALLSLVHGRALASA